MYEATDSRSDLSETLAHSSLSAAQVFIFFLVVLSLCYAAALVTPYALSDDCTNLVTFRSGASWARHLEIAGGRPVLAFLANFFYRRTPDIGDLRYWRLFAVITVAVLSLCLYRSMRSAGWEWRHSVMVSLIAVTLPPFQIYVSIASCAFYPLAALFAAAAFYMAEAALRARTIAPRLGLAAGSVLVLLLAVTDFQPAAMFFWVFAAVMIFRSRATMAFGLRRLVWYGGLAATSLVLGFGFYKLGVAKYGSLLPSSRARLTSDILGKAVWFLGHPLADALNLVWVLPSPWVAIGVAAFASTGMLLYFEGHMGERLGKYIIALCLLPLAYLPNLVVAEDWSSYRTQIALTPLILLYLFFALHGYTRKLHKRVAERACTIILGLLAIVSISCAAYNVQIYFAIPASLELGLMRSQIATGNLARARSIYVIGSTWRDAIAPAVRYDEFGFPVSAQPWAPGPAMRLVVRELDPAQSGIPIEVAPADGPIKPPSGALVVDMRRLRDFR